MTQGKDAEVHGYPLKKRKSYTLNEGGIGIYSWKGCQVEVSGNFEEERTPVLIADTHTALKTDEQQQTTHQSRQSPIKQYLMAHAEFRRKRDVLHKASTEFKCFNYEEITLKWSDFDVQRTFTANLQHMGPRILLLGPVDCGKSTVCKSLMNWAQRLDDEPIFVELDCGQNAVSIPGTLCGDVVRDYHVPWRWYEYSEKVGSRNPFIYYYGHTSPSHNLQLYKHYVCMLSLIMKKKMLSFAKQRCAGSIINTCGWIDGALALSLIKHVMHAFCVNHIIVLQHKGQDKLLTSLHSLCKHIKFDVHICTLPPPDAAKPRHRDLRYQNRQRMCQHYFYGDKVPKKTDSNNDAETDKDDGEEDNDCNDGDVEQPA